MAGEDRSHLATGGSPLRSSVLMFENSQIMHLAVGRSTVRRRILALLLAEPGPRLHLREIQRRAATSPGTASRELAKLVAAGLIERQTEANQVYFRGSASPFATMLRSFLVTAPTPPPTSSGLHADGAGSAPPLHVVAEPSPSPADRVAISDGGGSGVMADPLGLKTGAVVAARMREIYGERVRGVFLYGHRTAGGAPRESDVELLVVLDRIERYGEELDRTSPVFASLSLELGVVVGRVFVSEADWRGRTDGGLPGVRTEAVFPVTPHFAELIDAADQAIATAHLELEADDVETAAEQACAAMLRLANACLDLDGLAPGPTRAVCVAYGERFGRTGRLDSAYHRWLLDAVDLRKASTRELTGPIDRAAGATAVERAEIFRDAVFRFAEGNG